MANGRGTVLLTGVGRRRSICESVNSSILDTTIESWERHFTVNARATWQLIKAFAERIPDRWTTEVTGRIVALTSDHTAHDLPYGQARAPSTVPSSRPPSSSARAACAPTSSIPDRSTMDG